MLVEVVDSGTGMPPAVQAHIFEPFFTTKGEGGTGLGLAQVFGIVQRHRGTIEVQSALGRGTTFQLSFPAAEASLAPRPVPAEHHLTRPLRILAVDDEPALARLAATILDQLGHTTAIAESGEQALALLAAEPFDVVLSDLGMGTGMNGWELAEQVSANWPRTRFVLVTGWGADIDPEIAQARGVRTVINKPYRTDSLLRALVAD